MYLGDVWESTNFEAIKFSSILIWIPTFVVSPLVWNILVEKLFRILGFSVIFRSYYSISVRNTPA